MDARFEAGADVVTRSVQGHGTSQIDSGRKAIVARGGVHEIHDPKSDEEGGG